MNQAAMRITASLLLWYLLSTMSIERGVGPSRAWDLSLIPHSSSLLAGVIIMWTSPYLWNIIAWLVSMQVLFQQGLIVLLFHSWMPRLACYLYSMSVCLSVCLSLRRSICFIELLIALPTSTRCTAIAPLFTVSALVVFCKAAGSSEPMRKP